MSTQSKTNQQLIKDFFDALEKSPRKDEIMEKNKDDILGLLTDYVFSDEE